MNKGWLILGGLVIATPVLMTLAYKASTAIAPGPGWNRVSRIWNGGHYRLSVLPSNGTNTIEDLISHLQPFAEGEIVVYNPNEPGWSVQDKGDNRLRVEFTAKASLTMPIGKNDLAWQYSL